MAKAMKAMMAMTAMKATRVVKKKVISARLTKRNAFFGKIDKTKTDPKKTDLIKNKAD